MCIDVSAIPVLLYMINRTGILQILSQMYFASNLRTQKESAASVIIQMKK
jgi:hypothetical protein